MSLRRRNLARRRFAMTNHKGTQTCYFEARVAFCCDRTIFAIERYSLAAPDEYEAERIARDRAVMSPYHDRRIPDFAIDVDIVLVDEPEPDDDPEAPAVEVVRPVCKACGSDDLACDGVARWDESTQTWFLSSMFDDIICGACDRAGPDIMCWLAVDAHPLTLGSHVILAPLPGTDAANLDGKSGVIQQFN
ncbi:MAG: hypothetical protein ABIV36_03350 [Sphingobium limneticum]